MKDLVQENKTLREQNKLRVGAMLLAERQLKIFQSALTDIAENLACGEGGDSYEMRAVAKEALEKATEAAKARADIE